MTGRYVRLGVLVLVALAAAPGLGACEPVLPMFLVLGGSATLARSLVVLVTAILVKALLFAWFARGTRRGPACAAMLWGNVVSTFIGCLAGAFVAGAPFLGLGVLAVVSILPARRIAGLFDERKMAVSVAFIALAMPALVFLSLILWSFAASLIEHEPGSLAVYWAFKVAYVFLGLCVSLVITVFWEEWGIWTVLGAGDRQRFVAIVRANLITLALVATVAALAVLPARFRAAHFLLGRDLAGGGAGAAEHPDTCLRSGDPAKSR